MKIDGWKSERIEVEINHVDVFNRIEKMWLNKQQGEWIIDGRWKHTEHTSHSWTKDGGEASPEQIKIYEAFQTIREVLKTLK